MLSLTLGPLALPVAPAVLLGATALAAALARRLARSSPLTGTAEGAALASSACWNALMVGLVAARLGHLVLHASDYAAAFTTSPWIVLDVRDGGWSWPVGWAGGLGWIALQAGRQAALRRALLTGSIAGVTCWTLGAWATGAFDRPGWPEVTVRALQDGRSATLAQAAAGRPSVVNLWASWCGPCRQEMPALAAAQRAAPDVAFLFVNQGESAEAVQAYLTDQGLPLREVWLDARALTGRAVGSAGLPTTLFFDASGRQIDAHFGVLNAAALAGRVRALQTPLPTLPPR